jgi:hypothetical protein
MLYGQRRGLRRLVAGLTEPAMHRRKITIPESMLSAKGRCRLFESCPGKQT